MRILEADLPPFTEAAFKSPEEAIAYGQMRASREWIRRINDRTSGRRVSNVSWDDTSLIVCIDTGDSLQFSWCDDRLAVELLEPARAPLANSSRFGDDEIQIQVAGHEVVWNRLEVAASMIGKEVFVVSVLNEIAFLTMRCGLDICMATLNERATGKRFLHWCPSQTG